MGAFLTLPSKLGHGGILSGSIGFVRRNRILKGSLEANSAEAFPNIPLESDRMKKTNTLRDKTPSEPRPVPAEKKVEETPYEAVASTCSVLVVGLFILTLLAQNYVIPSGSMENTLLIGDHLVVDRITLAPSAGWMPLVHYREPRHGDIVVFIKPVTDPSPVDGSPTYLTLVKRLIGMPGDHIHLRDGIVYINGVAQNEPYAAPTTADNHYDFVDEFPSVPPQPEPGNLIPESWAVDFHNHVVDGDLVIPPDMFFMMGDNRHNSADSRFWGFVPRQNIVGRPLFNYWSFKATQAQLEQTGIGNNLSWMAHVALHFFSDTRWKRTLHRLR
jgi:signal peptidase I